MARDANMLACCLTKFQSFPKDMANAKKPSAHPQTLLAGTNFLQGTRICWAEARVKIARMTLTIKLDRNWSSFQLANSAPPLSVTDSAIAPSARMSTRGNMPGYN